tara:strand:- start:2004 stop:2276 length:273 start_codon:yes stop_codon:yes gene_type:complete
MIFLLILEKKGCEIMKKNNKTLILPNSGKIYTITELEKIYSCDKRDLRNITIDQYEKITNEMEIIKNKIFNDRNKFMAIPEIETKYVTFK